MSDISIGIKAARKKAGLTQLEFADKLGIGRSSLAQYEAGIYKPAIETIKTMADVLNITIPEIMGVARLERPIKQVPITGSASCGALNQSVYEDSNRFANFNGDHWKESLYCVIAAGDSMSPEIDNGDEVIIDPTIKAISGDLVLYKIGDEIAIKLLYEDKEAYILQFIPYNQSEDFKTRTFRLDDEEVMSELLIHKVVGVNKVKTNNRAARLKMVGR